VNGETDPWEVDSAQLTPEPASRAGKSSASRILAESLLIARCQFPGERRLHEKATRQYGSNYMLSSGRHDFVAVT
jgi:hypothetical protein